MTTGSYEQRAVFLSTISAMLQVFSRERAAPHLEPPKYWLFIARKLCYKMSIYRDYEQLGMPAEEHDLHHRPKRQAMR